jgi:hypothetical protein
VTKRKFVKRFLSGGRNQFNIRRKANGKMSTRKALLVRRKMSDNKVREAELMVEDVEEAIVTAEVVVMVSAQMAFRVASISLSKIRKQ